MKLFLPEVVVGDRDGFTPENDLFGRKVIGDGLTHLVANVTDPLVVALDAPWGVGKTTFLKQWAGELRKAGYPVVFFDAFRHDYTDDAFAAIAGEIYALAETAKKQNTPRGKAYLASATKVGAVGAQAALRITLKVGTLGAIDAVEEAKVIGDELAALGDKLAGDLLKGQRERQKTFDKFRTALSGLSSELRGPAAAGEHRPLVLIIDELDRCRPVFALQVLERIKHFFSVPNVHFVLGVNLEQLRNSIRAAYGAETDASTYLQKFVHLVLTLRETGQHEHERSRRRFIEHLKQALELDALPDVSDCLALVRYVSEVRHVGLRSIERIVTDLARVLAFTPRNSRYAIPPILTGLCILRVLDADLYRDCVRGRPDGVRILQALCIEVVPPTDHSLHYELENARLWMAFCAGVGTEEDAREAARYLGRLPSPQDLLDWNIRNAVERLSPA